MAVALSAQDAAKRYEVRSAIIQKEMTTAGQKEKVQTTWYIDDFGGKEAVEMTVKAGFLKQQMLTVTDSESITAINLSTKSATRMKRQAVNNLPETINYLQLTPEIREKYALKEIGEEEVAGKSCKKYSTEAAQMGQTMQINTWIWKGIVLKSETSSNGKVVATDTAVKVEEDAAIPADKLAVPENVTVHEL
jgi:outer membrane lipoprotein-sorting protein